MVNPTWMYFAGFVVWEKMKEVKELGRCFVAKVVARSTIETAWKIGLKIEVLYHGSKLCYYKLIFFLFGDSICKFISLEFMEVPFLPYLWGTQWWTLLVNYHSISLVCVWSNKPFSFMEVLISGCPCITRQFFTILF